MTTATAQQIDLQKFCDDDEHGRYSIHLPWVSGGWKYATDGRVLVRVPAPDEPDYSCDERGRLPRAEEIMTPLNVDESAWQSWPRVDPCPACEATGKVKCEQCGGDGICDRCQCKAEHECGQCDGSGRVECATCSDSGGFDEFLFGKVELARRYAYLIAALPNVKFLPNDDTKKPVRFKFDGGEGCVMGFDAKH